MAGWGGGRHDKKKKFSYIVSSPCGGKCKGSRVISDKSQVGKTWDFRPKEGINCILCGYQH